ncbi:hypothetical protein [Nitratireductor sp. XY-223]|uniref:hypothetical protein n=1 Tax=Nitratireductor sp. XY-223 TaxID=2561926 RepID=UPI0010AA2F1E|nr:hypothetical protein [Nitratireductor sp. XY-223]
MRRKTVGIVLVTLFALQLAGCTTSGLTDASWLRPKADVGTQDPLTPVNPDDPAQPVEPIGSDQPAIPTEQTTTNSTPVPSTSTANLARQNSASTISFTPVIGAPVGAVQPLSRQLGSEARARGLVILNSGDGNSNHILKGYFSAFTDGDKTTVAFVWDVLDRSGTRLHRIRGQEVAQGTAADPWDVVQDATMEAIAARTIADYVAWSIQPGSGG